MRRESGCDEAQAVAKIERVHDDLEQVFTIARAPELSTHAAAEMLGEQRLAAGRKTNAAVR